MHTGSQRNEGQFGHRVDTAEQARKGGKQSSGQFGAEHGADPVETGRKGGKVSSGQFGAEHGADPVEAGRKGGEASRGGGNARGASGNSSSNPGDGTR